MSLRDTFHIGWQNELVGMALSSTIAAEAAHPLLNVLSQIKRKPARWDMTGESTLSIKGTSVNQFSLTAFILKGHNLASDATVRIRVFAGESQTGDVSYDSDDVPGADKIYTIKPWGESIAGIDPWGNYYDPSSNLDRVYSLPLTSTVRGKSVQIDLFVPTPTNGFVEIDKLAAFFAWAPAYGFDRGSVATIADDSKHTVMRSGGVRTTTLPARRRLDYDFNFLPDTDRNVFMSILEERGKGGDLYIISNPSWTGYDKFLGSSIFRRDNDASYKNMYHNGNTLAGRFLEN